MVWPIPTPTAIGTAPATAETWEAITYASALTTGTIADTTPKPTEVSRRAVRSSRASPHGRNLPDLGRAEAT